MLATRLLGTLLPVLVLHPRGLLDVLVLLPDLLVKALLVSAQLFVLVQQSSLQLIISLSILSQAMLAIGAASVVGSRDTIGHELFSASVASTMVDHLRVHVSLLRTLGFGLGSLGRELHVLVLIRRGALVRLVLAIVH